MVRTIFLDGLYVFEILISLCPLYFTYKSMLVSIFKFRPFFLVILYTLLTEHKCPLFFFWFQCKHCWTAWSWQSGTLLITVLNSETMPEVRYLFLERRSFYLNKYFLQVIHIFGSWTDQEMNGIDTPRVWHRHTHVCSLCIITISSGFFSQDKIMAIGYHSVKLLY